MADKNTDTERLLTDQNRITKKKKKGSLWQEDIDKKLESLSLNKELHRFSSFSGWNSPHGVLPENLARHGFYYRAKKEHLTCFFCDETFANWSENCSGMPNHTCSRKRYSVSSVTDSTGNGQTEELTKKYPCERPLVGEYQEKSARIDSYDHSCVRFNVPTLLLADAGLYVFPTNNKTFGLDRVKCFYCGGVFQNWDSDDDPWIKHACYYPTCPFLLRNKGEDFVHEILRQNVELPRPIIPNEDRLVASSVSKYNRIEHLSAKPAGCAETSFFSSGVDVTSNTGQSKDSEPRVIDNIENEISDLSLPNTMADWLKKKVQDVTSNTVQSEDSGPRVIDNIVSETSDLLCLDRVKCFHCGEVFQNWDSYDDPWMKHACDYPTCTFLLRNKEEDFVHDIIPPNVELPRPIIPNDDPWVQASVNIICKYDIQPDHVNDLSKIEHLSTKPAGCAETSFFSSGVDVTSNTGQSKDSEPRMIDDIENEISDLSLPNTISELLEKEVQDVTSNIEQSEDSGPRVIDDIVSETSDLSWVAVTSNTGQSKDTEPRVIDDFENRIFDLSLPNTISDWLEKEVQGVDATSNTGQSENSEPRVIDDIVGETSDLSLPNTMSDLLEKEVQGVDVASNTGQSKHSEPRVIDNIVSETSDFSWVDVTSNTGHSEPRVVDDTSDLSWLDINSNTRRSKDSEPRVIDDIDSGTSNFPSDANARRQTFDDLPIGHILRSPSFWNAGFFYTGGGDRVKCHKCERLVENWSTSDDPFNQKWHRLHCGMPGEVNHSSVDSKVRISKQSEAFLSAFNERETKPMKVFNTGDPMQNQIYVSNLQENQDRAEQNQGNMAAEFQDLGTSLGMQHGQSDNVTADMHDLGTSSGMQHGHRENGRYRNSQPTHSNFRRVGSTESTTSSSSAVNSPQEDNTRRRSNVNKNGMFVNGDNNNCVFTLNISHNYGLKITEIIFFLICVYIIFGGSAKDNLN